jgi:hypothetical protein
MCTVNRSTTHKISSNRSNLTQNFCGNPKVKPTRRTILTPPKERVVALLRVSIVMADVHEQPKRRIKKKKAAVTTTTSTPVTTTNTTATTTTNVGEDGSTRKPRTKKVRKPHAVGPSVPVNENNVSSMPTAEVATAPKKKKKKKLDTAARDVWIDKFFSAPFLAINGVGSVASPTADVFEELGFGAGDFEKLCVQMEAIWPDVDCRKLVGRPLTLNDLFR